MATPSERRLAEARAMQARAREMGHPDTPATPTAAGTAKPRKKAAEPAASAVAPPAVLTRPVRSTVDLSPVRHAALKRWSGEIAVEIGRSRVTTQDVLKALVARLLTDEVLARKIQDDLRQDKY